VSDAADVEGFVEREANRNRLRNPPLRDWLSVYEQSAVGAFTDAAPIVFKAKANHVIAKGG
jgi:hypothetical protein